MKGILRITAGLLAALSLTAALCAHAAERKNALRLHVIANSDSYEDQRVKLLVRDALLETFDGFSVDSREEAKTRLLAMGDELQSAAERVLYENGADYPVTLEAGEFEFPDRSYGGELYPAGEYSALRVILGAGEGQNWWCVMFPPLCVIDDGSGVSYNEDGTLEFRSFFAEIFRRLFG